MVEQAHGGLMRTLAEIRAEIDAIDDEILALLARRFALAPEVVSRKMADGISPVVNARVAEVINRNTAHAARVGVPPQIVTRLYTDIIDAMHDIESRMMAEKTQK